MSEFNKYSTDGGATFIDVEDTNGRNMSEELIRDTVGWTGKNKALAYPDMVVFGSAGEGFKFDSNANSLSYIAKIEAGQTYIATRASGQGNRFRIVLFSDFPTNVSTNNAQQVYNGDSTNEYTFTNTTYKYVVLVTSSNGGNSDANTKGMIRLATISDSTYEPYHDNVADEITRELTDSITNLTRTIFSTENLNDIMTPGLNYCDGSPTNSPQSLSWYMLIVTGRQGAIQQLVNKKELIYARNYGGNPATWSSWYKFTGTQV